MTNSRAKGRKNELRVAKFYQQQPNTIVQLAPMSRKWQDNQDFFGIWDLMVKKLDKSQIVPGEEAGAIDKTIINTFWVQVKSNQKPPLEPFQTWCDRWCNKYEEAHLWVVRDRRTARLFVMKPNQEAVETEVKL